MALAMRGSISVFNSLYNIDEHIYQEKIESLSKKTFYSTRSTENGYEYYYFYNLAKDIVAASNNRSLTRDDIKTIISEQTRLDNDNMPVFHFDDDILNSISSRIKDIIGISDEEILKRIISKNLLSEYGEQINNIYSDEMGTISLTIKDKAISLSIIGNSIEKMENIYRLKSEVIYIDDPFVLDNAHMFLIRGDSLNTHSNHLSKKILLIPEDISIIEEIIANNKLEKIYSKINSVCDGEIIINERNGLRYKKEGSSKTLNIKNMSTGLKTFVILKTLLMNGTIAENGTIILDEPEIHLHPEWQLLFAELIVLIQKEFNMNILLNTHSPYFLKAIEVYTAKYAIADKCKYYLAQMDGNMSIIKDVTNSTEEIYKQLAMPLQKLEDMRYGND